MQPKRILVPNLKNYSKDHDLIQMERKWIKVFWQAKRLEFISPLIGARHAEVSPPNLLTLEIRTKKTVNDSKKTQTKNPVTPAACLVKPRPLTFPQISQYLGVQP